MEDATSLFVLLEYLIQIRIGTIIRHNKIIYSLSMKTLNLHLIIISITLLF